jgi:hypothetical protein
MPVPAKTTPMIPTIVVPGMNTTSTTINRRPIKSREMIIIHMAGSGGKP